MPIMAPPPATRAHRSASTGTDIGGLLTILGRRLPSISAITLGSLALASVYLWVTPPSYTASTTLLIDPRPKKVVTEEGQGGLGTDLALLESQVAIIRSDAVLSRVVDNEKLKLAEDPEFAPQVSTTGIKAKLKALLGMKSADTDPKAQALAALAQHVVVKRAQKTYVVEIEASSSQPVKAARLTQAIVDAYLEDQTTAKAEDAKRANALIDGRLGELREQVRKAETRVDEFRKTNSILTSEGGTVGEQQLTKLNTELITARSQAAEAKARADEVTAAAKTGNPDVITDPAKQGLVQRLREQQATVARREASLSSQLLPKHPVLVDIRSQLTEIKTQIANELKRVAATAKAEYQIAENREKELAKTLETAKGEVGRTNTAQIKMRELEGEVAASRELLRVFLARSKETDEQQKITTPDARIISQPSVPTRPSKPVPALILALGLLGGLAAGIARALALDHVNTSLQTARDVEASTGMRTLAVITPPKTTVQVDPARSAQAGGPIAGSPFAVLAEALTKTKGRSLIGYRQSCLGVLSQIRSDGSRTTHTVLVTAPEAGSGSSQVAFSLAYAAANQGDRVLLIDAASGEPALSEGMSCPIPTDRAIKLHDAKDLTSITTRDPRCGLVVLPIALADLPSLKQLQRQRLLQGLREMSASFDLIVIDGGAVLEDESASIVLPLATQVILVARTGVTQAPALTAAAFQLDAARNKIVGVVLT